jgi:serine protease Do
MSSPRGQVLAAAASVVAMLALLGPCVPAVAESDPPELESASGGAKLARNTTPGIQLVETTYSASVTASVPAPNNVAFADLLERVTQRAVAGEIDATEEAVYAEFVDAFVKSPNTYIVRSGQVAEEQASVSGVGTGWVITPDGYVVTAAHVVQADDVELRQELANKVLADAGKAFVKELNAGAATFTQDQQARLSDAVLGWFAANISIDDLRTDVAVLVSEGVEGIGKRPKAAAADVVDVGKPYPGNDVAVLKIDAQNMPTLPLGTDDDVEAGTQLNVAGYPAASTFGKFTEFVVNITEGPVTSIKRTEEGMPVFQTQAPASPGNSGGPVLTDNGDVVGVLVAQAVGSDGVALEGQEYVLPVSVVQEMLAENEIEPETSGTSAAYAEGLDEFYEKRYKNALPLFQEVEKLYPKHPDVDELINDTNAAIAAGEDRTPVADTGSSALRWLVPLLLALILLGSIAAGLVFWMVRRAKGKTALAGVLQQQPVPVGYPTQSAAPSSSRSSSLSPSSLPPPPPAREQWAPPPPPPPTPTDPTQPIRQPHLPPPPGPSSPPPGPSQR